MRLLMLLGLLVLALLAGWLYLNSTGPQITPQKTTLATTEGCVPVAPMLQEIAPKLKTHLTLASHCQVTFSGTVEEAHLVPSDGDWHMLIRPQTGSMRYVNGPPVDLIRGCGLTDAQLQALDAKAPNALILAELTQEDRARLGITKKADLPHRLIGTGVFVKDSDGSYLQAENGEIKGPKVSPHCEVHPLYDVQKP